MPVDKGKLLMFGLKNEDGTYTLISEIGEVATVEKEYLENIYIPALDEEISISCNILRTDEQQKIVDRIRELRKELDEKYIELFELTYGDENDISM